MSDEADRIRREMQNVRQVMGHEVHAVVERAKQLSDWRYYVRQHPWICTASALAIGFLAMPAKRKAPNGTDVQELISQLKKHGLTVASATPTTGGLMAKALAVAGPFVLRNAASLVAQQFHGAAARPPADASSPSEAS